jgi:ABC-2 type transport system ATP-binding protein
MITAQGLTKRYGPTVAVRDLTFTVRPGVVVPDLHYQGARSAPLRARLWRLINN